MINNMILTITNQMMTMKVINMKILIWLNTIMIPMTLLTKKIARPIIMTALMVIVNTVVIFTIPVTATKLFVNHVVNIFTIVTVLNHFVEVAVEIMLVMALWTYAIVKNLFANAVNTNRTIASAVKSIVSTVTNIGMIATAASPSVQIVIITGTIVIVCCKFVRGAIHF